MPLMIADQGPNEIDICKVQRQPDQSCHHQYRVKCFRFLGFALWTRFHGPEQELKHRPGTDPSTRLFSGLRAFLA
jgi:hypothetical protein